MWKFSLVWICFHRRSWSAWESLSYCYFLEEKVPKVIDSCIFHLLSSIGYNVWLCFYASTIYAESVAGCNICTFFCHLQRPVVVMYSDLGSYKESGNGYDPTRGEIHLYHKKRKTHGMCSSTSDLGYEHHNTLKLWKDIWGMHTDWCFGELFLRHISIFCVGFAQPFVMFLFALSL